MPARPAHAPRARSPWRTQARALCLALALPLAAQAQEAPAPAASSPAKAGGSVYKWKDANGRVHYGDQAPSPKASPLPLIVDQPSDDDVRAAQQRQENMRAESDARAAARRATPPVAPPQGAVPVSQQPAPQPQETACQARWRAYNESLSCFDPFKIADGTLSAKDAAKCKPLPRPAPCN